MGIRQIPYSQPVLILPSQMCGWAGTGLCDLSNGSGARSAGGLHVQVQLLQRRETLGGARRGSWVQWWWRLLRRHFWLCIECQHHNHILYRLRKARYSLFHTVCQDWELHDLCGLFYVQLYMSQYRRGYLLTEYVCSCIKDKALRYTVCHMRAR